MKKTLLTTALCAVLALTTPAKAFIDEDDFKQKMYISCIKDTPKAFCDCWVDDMVKNLNADENFGVLLEYGASGKATPKEKDEILSYTSDKMFSQILESRLNCSKYLAEQLQEDIYKQLNK